MGRRGNTPHSLPWAVVGRATITHRDHVYQLKRQDRGLVVTDGGDRFPVGDWADADSELVVKLTPGLQTYLETRQYHGVPLNECDLVAGVIVAAIVGHPDAEADRAGTQLSAIWSHHLAIVAGEDPRWVAKTYAPTETMTIAHRVQNMAAEGVLVEGCG